MFNKFIGIIAYCFELLWISAVGLAVILKDAEALALSMGGIALFTITFIVVSAILAMFYQIIKKSIEEERK